MRRKRKLAWPSQPFCLPPPPLFCPRAYLLPAPGVLLQTDPVAQAEAELEVAVREERYAVGAVLCCAVLCCAASSCGGASWMEADIWGRAPPGVNEGAWPSGGGGSTLRTTLHTRLRITCRPCCPAVQDAAAVRDRLKDLRPPPRAPSPPPPPSPDRPQFGRGSSGAAAVVDDPTATTARCAACWLCGWAQIWQGCRSWGWDIRPVAAVTARLKT